MAHRINEEERQKLNELTPPKAKIELKSISYIAENICNPDFNTDTILAVEVYGETGVEIHFKNMPEDHNTMIVELQELKALLEFVTKVIEKK